MNNGQTIIYSGGVGGAKLVLGMSHLLAPEKLTVVTNTGDDFDHYGLRICPDTDTSLYTLSGLSDQEKGWGRAEETWRFMQAIKDLGGEDWFNLGDTDLALHLIRTQSLAEGKNLTQVTQMLADTMGIHLTLLPMTNDRVATKVMTKSGQLDFQHYFVRDQCRPEVTGFSFQGLSEASVNPQLIRSLDSQPDAIIFAPSNPYVSIDPIIKLPELLPKMRQSDTPIVAVSPIVGGTAIKGPAAKMMFELGLDVSPLAIAEHYKDVIHGLVIDEQDKKYATAIESFGLAVQIAPTIMHDLSSRINLAQTCLDFAQELKGLITP
jgi:LPPG:FO 2-phospho-L-lactate transferase